MVININCIKNEQHDFAIDDAINIPHTSSLNVPVLQTKTTTHGQDDENIGGSPLHANNNHTLYVK